MKKQQTRNEKVPARKLQYSGVRKEGYSALFGLPYGGTMKNYMAQYHAAMQSDKQENCYGEPVGEQQSNEHFRAALDSIKDWCRCNGGGFWYEQIDGPDNMRKPNYEISAYHIYVAEPDGKTVRKVADIEQGKHNTINIKWGAK